MDARRETEPAPMKHPTTTERTSDRELVVKRIFNAPARIVFEAWAKPELFKRWWGTESMGCPASASWMTVPGASTSRLGTMPDADEVSAGTSK